ncbi:SprT-like family-domain-containing protein [Echria macrotheca]|uniref:SprT-like family-domain-containing protein n=1 Tax=Echria macrotheca TaxID=438768 RepID=A0AAJ0FBI9_9PEZI|nr:SprT-like family-domain-containing protein [Echria macrotheca]
MASPFAGGDELPPFPLSDGYPNPVAVKRRPIEVDDDDAYRHSSKRLRYFQQYHSPFPASYEDQVAFKAVADKDVFGVDPIPVPSPVPRPDYHLLPRHHSPHPSQKTRYHHNHNHNNHHHHHRRHHHHDTYQRLSHSQPPSPHRALSPEPAPAACAMERSATTGGLSISSEPSACTELLEDEEAEQRVREHMANFRRRNPDSKHERILRSIICPRSSNAAEYPLDNDSMESIFSTANELFFNGRLSQRVMWEWSHASSPQYDSHVIGTTALRRASNRGFETLIVLSSPILRDPKYSRRLLISTFLHELIHSYLFICCGFRARHCGGHTPAFRAIAKMIDDWAGAESALHLARMEADLERFRIDAAVEEEEEEDERYRHRYHEYYPCSGITDQQGLQQQPAQTYSSSPASFDGYSSSSATPAAFSWWDNNSNTPGPGAPRHRYRRR